ncbi:hypothetical protein [Reichenbachiella versicolor]|uniref:hypothetical protein n=1 Tax=Reichenbachiella versicolor TaxID=1821036 RepID=UPI000D6DF859|nr:hypothetical protein [Reichenbachiella versicolor]
MTPTPSSHTTSGAPMPPMPLVTASHSGRSAASSTAPPSSAREILLIWFNGTGTPMEDMAPLLTHLHLSPSQMQSISGLGTEDNLISSKALSSNSNLHSTGSWFDPTSYTLFNTILGTKDTTAGYAERNQFASINAVFNTIDKISTSSSSNIELIIGGHSRGAAAGIIGFLSSLLEAISKDKSFRESPLYKKVKKIHVISVDPVAGQRGNDLTGGEDIRIDQLYKSIQSKFENTSLISTTLYQARFDCRDEFKADDKWLNYLKANYNFVTATSTNPSFRYYIAGFRHSIMIYPNDGELSKSLYANTQVTPLNLLINIINDIVGNTNTAQTIFDQLIALEKETVFNLKLYPLGYPKLSYATSVDGYSAIEKALSKIYVFTGTSLVDTVKDKPDSILVSSTPVNNRYTFYFFNK